MSANKLTRILYVEDDLNLSMVVIDFLQIQGYTVQHFENAEDVINQWQDIKVDICLLDIMLPNMNGYDLAKFIKTKEEHLPIIFLSAKNQIKDKIQGLEIGADDYITKPFSTIELDLRINIILKRAQRDKQKSGITNPPINIQLGKINYIESELKIVVDNETTTLTKKENLLLRSLVLNINKIVKRDDLLSEIWGENNYHNSRSMDVYLSKLRKILSAEPKINIVNFHGTGFKLDSSKL